MKHKRLQLLTVVIWSSARAPYTCAATGGLSDRALVEFLHNGWFQLLASSVLVPDVNSFNPASSRWAQTSSWDLSGFGEGGVAVCFCFNLFGGLEGSRPAWATETGSYLAQATFKLTICKSLMSTNSHYYCFCLQSAGSHVPLSHLKLFFVVVQRGSYKV